MTLQGQVKVKTSLGGSVNIAPTRTEIVDNLETADSGKALSANQGVVLKKKTDALEETVQGIIDDLNYKAIDITAFSNTAGGVHEIGEIVTALTLTWSLNKEPVSQTLDGLALATDVRSVTELDMKITENRTFTLKVTDERGETDTASTSISFLNGVYYGVLENGAAINNAAVLGLTRKLQGSRGLTFTANAGATQRIAFAIPSRYGTPTFKDAETGFQAGFYKASTFAFTNASGYTENYDVWLSTNAGLGSLTATVS